MGKSDKLLLLRIRQLTYRERERVLLSKGKDFFHNCCRLPKGTLKFSSMDHSSRGSSVIKYIKTQTIYFQRSHSQKQKVTHENALHSAWITAHVQ